MEPREALQVIVDLAPVLSAENRHITEAQGFVLAKDIVADTDIPPFDNSAMDGFAVNAADIASASADSPATLQVIDEQPAGKSTSEAVTPGVAVRIMTGAPIPSGADCVVQVELTRPNGSQVDVLQPVAEGANIREAGEDMAAGSLAIPSGQPLSPVEIGLLASLGRSQAKVIRKPRVAIIGTGNELIDVDSALVPGKIRDSNSYALLAGCAACGIPAERLGVAVDTKLDVVEKIKAGLTHDVIITSGGVSVGDYDFVKDVLADIGAKQHFWGIKQKPGKPMAFWTLHTKLVFGLPGNPVASMLCFEEYVRPALLKMMGRSNLYRPVVRGRLTAPIKKKAGRTHFIGVRVEQNGQDYLVSVNGRQGSGILKSLSGANGIGILPKESSQLDEGDYIEVQLVDRPEDH